MEKKYIKINEDIYDITDFSKIHPGGGIINHYVGFDGTQAFKAFHFRSEKAGKMLKTLTKVDPINTSMDNLTFKQYSLNNRNHENTSTSNWN